MQVELRERTFGELIGLTFNLAVAHFPKLFMVAGLLGLPNLAMGLIGLPLQPDADRAAITPEEAITRLLLVFLSSIVALLLLPVQQGASILIVSGSFTGHAHSWPQSLRVGLAKFWPLVAYSFVTGLIIGFGLFLLIVPAFIFLTWYFVGAPAIIVENLPWREAMARSKELSAGWRMQILGFVVTLGFILNLIYFGLSAIIIGWLGEGVPSVLITYIIGVVIYIPGIIGAVVYYFHLRVVKEAFDVQALTSLVDAIEARARAPE